MVIYMKTNIYFLSFLDQFFLEWEMFQTNWWTNSKYTFFFNNFFFENRAAYEIMWKNTVEPGKP